MTRLQAGLASTIVAAIVAGCAGGQSPAPSGAGTAIDTAPVTIAWNSTPDELYLPILMAVKAMQEIGPRQVVEYAKRFGLDDAPPYLSLALGSGEATLLQMTSAYSAFANRGVRMTPYGVISITDRDGNLLDERRPEPH